MTNHDPESIAFPTLTEDEILAVESLGSCVDLQDGDVLFTHGDVCPPFFVVTSGAVSITEYSSGDPSLVTVHGPGEFTGDIDMLTGRPVFVTATAKGETQVVRVENDQMRRLMQQVPSLGEKFILAFDARRFLLTQSGFEGVKVYGQAARTHRIREFLFRNFVPFTSFEETKDAAEILVDCGNGSVLNNPSLYDLAQCLGVVTTIPDHTYGLAVVGAGPSGLAAAVYAASEGVDTIVIDGLGPGGQASGTSLIENFIGFPSGISGAELARRAYLQILKFGGNVYSPLLVERMSQEGDCHILHLDNGETIRADSVLIATGVRYRRLPAEGADRFEGLGIYHAATSVEGRHCEGTHVTIIGAGNSAGQAAMYMSERAASVRLVVRGDNLEKSMSAYLANRIHSTASIEVMLETEVVRISGDDVIGEIDIKSKTGGSVETVPCDGLFVFIGSEPNTDWLPDCVQTDDLGYIMTGIAAKRSDHWPLERDPEEVETTCPGVFAAGDVRSGNTRRVAFAAGDGAMAVTCVNRYRAHIGE